jgi:hypothetical protein
MVNQDVVGVADIPQLAVVTRQVLDARLCRLDEDIRLVAGAAEDALNAEDFVANRVAIAERGQHLMDRDGHRQRAPPPPPPPGRRPRRCRPLRR